MQPEPSHSELSHSETRALAFRDVLQALSDAYAIVSEILVDHYIDLTEDERERFKRAMAELSDRQIVLAAESTDWSQLLRGGDLTKP